MCKSHITLRLSQAFNRLEIALSSNVHILRSTIVSFVFYSLPIFIYSHTCLVRFIQILALTRIINKKRAKLNRDYCVDDYLSSAAFFGWNLLKRAVAL